MVLNDTEWYSMVISGIPLALYVREASLNSFTFPLSSRFTLRILQTQLFSAAFSSLCRRVTVFPTHHHHCAAVASRGWEKASACCFLICLSRAILCQMVPSSSRPVRLSNVSPVFLWVFSFRRVSWWWCAVSIGYLVSCWRALPTVTLVFSLTQMFVYLSRCVKFNILPSLFVRLV